MLESAFGGRRLGLSIVFTALFLSIIMAGSASAYTFPPGSEGCPNELDGIDTLVYGAGEVIYEEGYSDFDAITFDWVSVLHQNTQERICQREDGECNQHYDFYLDGSGSIIMNPLADGSGDFCGHPCTQPIKDFGKVSLTEIAFGNISIGAGGRYNITTPEVNHTYGLFTNYWAFDEDGPSGGWRAKIYITKINSTSITFDWVYQSDNDVCDSGFGINPQDTGCKDLITSATCDADHFCEWDYGKGMCDPECPSTFSDPNTAKYECEGYLLGETCKYDEYNNTCKFQPFNFGSYGCGIEGVSDNKTSCDTNSNCTWDDLAPGGGKCIIDCWSMKNQSACSSTDSIFYLSEQNKSLCVWKPTPYTSYPATQGACDPFFFEKNFGGFSPCFEFDGNETGCTSSEMSDECKWFSEPYCTEPGCFDKDDSDGDLNDHGWCDPKFGFQDMFDILSGPEAECWRLDGNKSGCNAMKEEFQQPCVWFPDPWAPDKTNEEGGWCNMEFGAFFGGAGGAGGCWGIIDETNCNDATAIGCTWENDPFNPNGGFCREQGCWDFDNQNDTCAEFSNNMSFFNCTWEGNPPGDNTTGWCFEDWQDFDCHSNDDKSKACFDTFYCVWNQTDSTCVDPMDIGPGIGFPGPMGPNPGCFILPTEQKCLEVNDSNGKLCQWNGGGNVCQDNGGNPLNATEGIKCEHINNSKFCNNIPFLSTCCKWSTVTGNCTAAPYSTACWDNMKPPPPGAQFCEDYNAINNETLCGDIAGDPWYMPCKWDTSVEPDECRFKFDDMFVGKDMFDIGFSELTSMGQSSCEKSGGVWFQEKWTDPFGQIFMDEWCEMGIGKGFETCNTSCWACEFQDNGSNWDPATQADDMRTACENSPAPPNNCTFIPDTNAMNGIGWCDVNFTFIFTDFIFEDCFTPWSDSDGDGLLPDKDPDCVDFFKWGGFIEAETGHECEDGIDNDGNNKTDCLDPNCMFDTFFCPPVDLSTDNDPPEIKLLTLDRYTDGAFFDIVTNEPTNATILFYYTDSACNSSNQSNVTDPKLNNTEGANWTQFDDYDIWHGIPVDNIYLAQLALPPTLQNGTAYYYKAQVFDKAGNNATGKCSNFTTLNETTNFTVGFKLPPPEDDNTTMLGYLRVQFDWDGDGVFEDNQSSDTEKKKVNKSKAKKVNIRFFNPFAADAWEIQILGAKFKDKDGGRVLNITDAFVVNNSGTDIIVGMKKSVWSELAQKLGADYLRIIIPKGSSGLVASSISVNHCPDNATEVDQDDCNSVYNASDTTKADCTITASQTICDIPVNIGFSVFGVAGDVVSSPPSSGGGGGGAEAKDIEVNATIENGKVVAVFAKISKDKTGTMVIPDTADVAFRELAIKVKSTVTNAKIEIYNLDEKPSSITEDVTGTIQSYIQLDETNIEAADIDTVTIKFKVPVSWITDENIDKTKVVLNRYADGKWTALTTTKVSEDSTNVQYSAVSPGLSTFGVSGEVQKAEPVLISAPTTAPPVTTAPPITAPPTVPHKVVPEKKKFLGICGPNVVLLLAMLPPVAYRLRRKRRTRYRFK